MGRQTKAPQNPHPAPITNRFTASRPGKLGSVPATETHNGNAIELAIARIHDEYARNLNMTLLARELGVSYSWFRASFAAHTGLGPHQYLLELRLVRARNLLAPEMPEHLEIYDQATS